MAYWFIIECKINENYEVININFHYDDSSYFQWKKKKKLKLKIAFNKKINMICKWN